MYLLGSYISLPVSRYEYILTVKDLKLVPANLGHVNGINRKSRDSDKPCKYKDQHNTNALSAMEVR